MIVPCFNESKRLDLQYWRETIGLTPSTFWLFVNDGSTDRTSDVLLSMNDLENFQLLELSDNAGKSEAIRSGVLNLMLTFELIGYVDADACFSPSFLSAFMNEGWELLLADQSTTKMIIGSRVKLSGKHVNRTTSRHLIGRVVISILGIFWSDIPYDPQSGMKLLRINTNDHGLFRTRFDTRWFFDLELMVRLGMTRSNRNGIVEIPLDEWQEVKSGNFSIRKYPLVLREIARICALLNRESRKVKSKISS